MKIRTVVEILITGVLVVLFIAALLYAQQNYPKTLGMTTGPIMQPANTITGPLYLMTPSNKQTATTTAEGK